MKKVISVFLLLAVMLSCQTLFSQSDASVHYTVDLNNTADDIVRVSLHIPALSKNDTMLIFAASAPGTYDRLNFGQYVQSVTVYDAQEKATIAQRSSTNTFILENPTTIRRIDYMIVDTWDDKTENRKRLFNPGGTNFQKDTCFVLNYFAVCAYLPSFKKSPMKVTVLRPQNLRGASALPLIRQTATEDIYQAEDYDHLADNPALYASSLDTVQLTIRDAKVTVAVYSEKGKIKASQIAGTIKPVISANADFLGKMPVSYYSFLFVLGASPQNSGDGNYGALEHSYSSLYYLPESDNYTNIENMISHTASHEFLHIKIPLHLHSKEIDDFNFLNPKMSKHLWLYEGVTEYFAHLSQIPLSGEEAFMKQMRQKIQQMQFFKKKVGLTELAINVMEPEMQEVYPMIYDRGALIAMMFDIRLRELTNGTKTLPWLVDTLSSLYGKNKPFDDNELFPKIISITAPEMQQFIDTFIVGAPTLPLREYLGKIGYDYEEQRSVQGYKFEDITVRFVSASEILLVPKSPENSFKAQEGDIIVNVDNETLSPESLGKTIGKIMRPKSDAEVKITVKRGDSNVTLQAKPISAMVTENHALAKKTAMTPSEQKMYSQLFHK